LPGARTVGTDFATVFAGTAARAVQHVLRTPRDGTDATIQMQHAFAAGGAFFRPDAPFLQNADERGVEAGVNGFVAVTLGDGLHAGAAADGQHGVVSLDGFGGLFEEDVVALAFDGEFLDFQGAAF